MNRPRAPWRGCDIKPSTRLLGSYSQTAFPLGIPAYLAIIGRRQGFIRAS
jgi:hypothetical protein